MYYNYRHYEPIYGRWICRDPIGNLTVVEGIYGFCGNLNYDFDGLGALPIVQPIGNSPSLGNDGDIWFGVAFGCVNRGDPIKVVKSLKFNVYDCKTKEKLFSDGKTWSEEFSYSSPNTNVRWAMLGPSMPMSALALIIPPGEDKCRYGKIELSSDFFTNNVPDIKVGKDQHIPAGLLSWFKFEGDDSVGNHAGYVIGYKGRLPSSYSNSGAFATLKMQAEYSCGETNPRITVWTTGSWRLDPTQRIDLYGNLRGPLSVTDADEWWMNGKKVNLVTMEIEEK